MYPIKKSIEQGFSGKPGGLYDILTQLQNMSLGNQGTVYYIDSSKGSDGYDGLSWDKAFKTLAYGISVSNAKRSGYERNTIFVRGKFSETLTTAPSKCDLIGVGATSARSRPRITGAQAMTNTAYGTRFINLEFRGVASSVTMTWTASGFEIHNCVFSQPSGQTMATHAITIVNPHDVVIQGCDFLMTNEAFFSTACIALTSTEVPSNCHIRNCKIRGAVGVVIGVGSDDHFYNCSIEDCYIYSSGLCVNDESGNVGWALINNRVVTQAANSDNDMLVYNTHLAAGNVATGATDTNHAPDIVNTHT